MRKEIADRANELFAEYMDLPPVYAALIKEGIVVSYPKLVEFFNQSPLSRKLPLEKFIDRSIKERKQYTRPVKRILKSTKKTNKPIRIPKETRTSQNLDEKIEPIIENSTKIRDELYPTFVKLLNYKAREQGWAAEQATLFDAITQRQYSFEKTIKILDDYERKKKADLPFSIHEIAKDTTMKEGLVRKIAKTLELQVIKMKIDDKMDIAIRNALKITEINVKEAAYFLKIPLPVMRDHIREKQIPYFKKTAYPNFIEASKIYEARDAGFDLKETAEYVKVNQRNTENAIQRRAYLEPQIIEILKKIYPDREINKPYL